MTDETTNYADQSPFLENLSSLVCDEVGESLEEADGDRAGKCLAHVAAALGHSIAMFAGEDEEFAMQLCGTATMIVHKTYQQNRDLPAALDAANTGQLQ